LNLKVKAKLFFEKEVAVCYSTLCNIPADFNLQQERSRNLCLSRTLKLTAVHGVNFFEKRVSKEVI